jgi:hypothetical protein
MVAPSGSDHPFHPSNHVYPQVLSQFAVQLDTQLDVRLAQNIWFIRIQQRKGLPWTIGQCKSASVRHSKPTLTLVKVRQSERFPA